MKLSTALLFLVGGMYWGYILYVPMPTDMDSHLEFYWKAAGFKFATTLMYMKHIFCGGSTIDFSFIQFGLNLLSTLHRPVIPDVTVDDTTLAGVRVLLYQPTKGDQENRPAFIFFHGGGLTVGSVDIYLTATHEIAESLEGTVVISVDYRLAPAHPFPAAYEDSVAVTKWLLTHAANYGVDPKRVAVGGDSAGGYLASAVSQAVHDDPALPKLRAQVLLFPWLQHLDYQTPSYQKNHHFFGSNTWLPNWIPGFCINAYYDGVLNDSLVAHMVTNHHTSAAFKNSALYRRTFNHSKIPLDLRDPAYYTPPASQDFGDDGVWNELKDIALDTRFHPILREDMSGLPRAYIATCGFDPLRDDGIFYYHRLREDGVDAEWVHHPEAFHGADWFGPMMSEAGRKVKEGFLAFIKKHI